MELNIFQQATEQFQAPEELVIEGSSQITKHLDVQESGNTKYPVDFRGINASAHLPTRCR